MRTCAVVPSTSRPEAEGCASGERSPPGGSVDRRLLWSWEEYEVVLFLVAYTEVKLLREEKKRDHELCVVISTLVGLRETRHALQSDLGKVMVVPPLEVSFSDSYMGINSDSACSFGRQQKQQYTNQLAKETDKYIKEFGSLPATSEQRQRKIQKDRLVGEFTTALTNFQRLQRQAAEKEKDFVARVRASSRVSGGAPEDNYKEGTLVSWDSQPQAQVQDEEITEDDLRLIEERESSIRQLEADIMDINEIFKDLGMMIHEQGDVIDSIEANVENADVHVQQANQQLSRAANYQCVPENTPEFIQLNNIAIK
ncbi:hypothetical protein HGM15179_002244 [Zosterops borbonicus]|uniref:Syntaxin-7 n=1 Tax=Zosterops borbonicus TaxID=364589 RepID=A0A8K1GX25_9PASS|nr:hypothetical protein HGM15179_002244 [Zosterops borbonicus]